MTETRVRWSAWWKKPIWGHMLILIWCYVEPCTSILGFILKYPSSFKEEQYDVPKPKEISIDLHQQFEGKQGSLVIDNQRTQTNSNQQQDTAGWWYLLQRQVACKDCIVGNGITQTLMNKAIGQHCNTSFPLLCSPQCGPQAAPKNLGGQKFAMVTMNGHFAPLRDSPQTQIKHGHRFQLHSHTGPMIIVANPAVW